jgi:RHS repeat-associated protein
LTNGSWQTQYQRDLFGLKTGCIFADSRTERDSLGRVTGQKIEKNNRYLSEKSYLWGTNDKLLSVITNGKIKDFGYDNWGNLSKTIFEDGKIENRNPDKTGNLFERLDRMDRKYTAGGRLVKTENREYKYDKEGNLIRKKDKHGATWRYEWNEAGMLESVKRPDAAEVTFKYDALGRRIEKRFGKRTTVWVWDGNVPLHEKTETRTPDYSEEKGYFDDVRTEPVVTWVFEEGTFVPAAKITEQQQYSIVTNYLGTPEAMYREDGEEIWACELNSYGKVRNWQGKVKTDCPFRYQGQYEDAETGLYYNRFRYYSPEEGMYLSQDPIRLNGGFKLYSYVFDPNTWIDELGLTGCPPNKKKKEQVGSYTITFASRKKYHGKGPKSRMEKSAKYHSNKNNDSVTNKDWTSSKDDTHAFKDEYARMQTDASSTYPEGYKNPNNYNQRQSPGKKK